MALVDRLVAQAMQLDMALVHAHARLQARTDSEALHDLRISLRRLRSLLRPLRRVAGTRELEQTASELGRLTTPVRDLEVLIDELHKQGWHAQAERRQRRLHAHYRQILQSPASRRLFTLLAQWPAAVRQAERAGELQRIKRHISRHLRQRSARLQAALAAPRQDLHRLRLLVKQLRYGNDAFAHCAALCPQAQASLKQVQGALGDWHDGCQWCLYAQQNQDLHALATTWQRERATRLREAERELGRLAQHLNCEAGASGSSARSRRSRNHPAQN